MGYVDREEWGLCVMDNCENFIATKNVGLCSSHYRKKLYWDNPEKHRARAKEDQRKTREANPELAKRKRKSNDLLVNYGIRIEDYEYQYDLQDGRCAICNRKENDLGKPLAVDHCHTTGKVRGLLCFKCNTGLGNFQDDPAIMEEALKYIRNEGVWA